VERGSWIEPAPGVRARYLDAGHILGACSIELEIATGDPSQRLLRLLFSGDLGPEAKAFYRGPQGDENFDYVVVESTYGDRERPPMTTEGRRNALKAEVLAALKAGGNLLIPAFAVERTQELLSDLVQLMAVGAVPKAPVFLDSPLAIHATEVFERYRARLELGSDAVDPFRAPNIHFTMSAEQSAQLSRIAGGAIIIAASGMCDAGRIRRHLESNLWRADATVLLVGYQARGTLGSLIERGARKVRIHGQEIAVVARIRKLEVYSGHADRGELLHWLKARLPIAGGVFVTHGEESAIAAMKTGIAGLGIDAARIALPRLDQSFELSPAAAPRAAEPGAEARLSPIATAAVSEGRDWHNDYASFALDLQDGLARMTDDRDRMLLLGKLRSALADERADAPPRRMA
jgi:metallo-beta-lactamase family protein